ncbi:MAG TPA: 4-(cytidine 5'-diphospho)-2-C-methyl-D-erythritol kinase [Stellaceae bacterium]|nr:4-(cytidine 5'-diphospho)-2-C-methyl-D-erythritol kinase [Stellaceae bacterium]
MDAPERLADNAPAKVNLTLSVIGRRPDGYHDLESLVAFAALGDELSLTPGGELALTVSGPSAAQAGDAADNLVVKAALALAARVPELRLGAFHLDKRLPVAAGLGGGSADAAAALRLLARANGVAVYDARLFEAARATGADVPVCLDPRPRLMRGIGDVLSAPLTLPPLPAILVNPGVAVATKSVFVRWTPAAAPTAFDLNKFGASLGRDECLQLLALHGNDLESPAIALEPTIAEVLAALRALPGCRLARMSGSGATCFALFASAAAAIAGAQALTAAHAQWWVRATALGGA